MAARRGALFTLKNSYPTPAGIVGYSTSSFKFFEPDMLYPYAGVPFGQKNFSVSIWVRGDTRRRQRYSNTAAVVIVWAKVFKGTFITFIEPCKGTAKKQKEKKEKGNYLVYMPQRVARRQDRQVKQICLCIKYDKNQRNYKVVYLVYGYWGRK